MKIQTKSSRRKSFATALFLGVPLIFAVPSIGDDSLASKRTAKTVPAFVAANFDKAKLRTVHVNKAVVRSGPSDKYYATSTLMKDAIVEVYMETSDGWSGIRPPAGSHNWIPSNIAYLLPGGKSAEVTQDKSPAWVGSDSSDVSEFMWQMELLKSQQVQVLGEEMQLTEDGKKQLWYRISPPQGEFRWIKTSQLSDAPASKSRESAIQLANYVEDENAAIASGKNKSGSGKIVWSDEKKTLEQVEAQIQQEQAEIQRNMQADGIHVSLDSPRLEVNQHSTSSKQIGDPNPSNNSVVEEDFVTDSDTMEPQITTRIRPIAESIHPRRTKTQSKSADHQIDGQRQWEAMQSANPKLRVRPVSSILGLLGFSIIEAERAPVSTHIAQQYHTNSPQGRLGTIGPVGNSRLDRLPRPGNRPSMSLPVDGSEITIPQGTDPSVWNSGPTATALPSMNQGESTFSRWMNSREPVFGSSATQPPYNPMLAASGLQTVQQANPNGNSLAIQPQSSPGMLETTAWHGLGSAQRGSNSQPFAMSNDSNDPEGSEDVEQFRTPEIQSALVHLTREVASPTEEWNFSGLKTQAASWVENGSTAIVRGEARLLLERIDRFESLRQRTMGFTQNATMIAQQAIGNASSAAIQQASVSPTSAASLNTIPGSSGVSNAIATNTLTEGDASGWLVQVHTTIKGQPEFALTDDAGKVITYVQSSPAINLRRYLQQPVTVYGVRGYIPNLASKQILAERVVRMR